VNACRAARALAAAWACLGLLACASSPPPAPSPPASTPTASYSKNLERSALERNVETSLPHLRACYPREGAPDLDVERHMALVLYVMPSGTVEDVGVVNAREAADPDRPSRLTNAIASCVRAEVMRWQFPATSWHGDLYVNQPPLFFVNFSPKPAAVHPTPDQQAVGAVMRRHLLDFKNCFRDYTRRTPFATSQDVSVRFVILPSGTISEAAIAEPAQVDPELAGCLLGAMRTMQFDPTEKDRPKTITFPLRLRLD
jgi:hypothetical protein